MNRKDNADFTLEEQPFYDPPTSRDNLNDRRQMPSCSGLSAKLSKECVDSSIRNPRRRSKKYTTAGCELKEIGLQKGEKGIYKSKNLVTERKRRKRIKDGMFALRALVPKISKMDSVSTLGDASEYIKELQETIDNYHNELRETEEEQDRKEVDVNCSEKPPPTEVQVIEVSQLGTKDFLLKITTSKRKRCGFSRLMEALDSLGLEVTDANVTTVNGSVSNVLNVEANGTEVDPNTLKRSLIQTVLNVFQVQGTTK